MLSPDEKRLVFDRIGYAPSLEQQAVHDDPSLVRLVAGGERGGKSRLAAAEVTANAADGALFWLIGKDFAAARGEFEHCLKDFQKLDAIERNGVSMPDKGGWSLHIKGGIEIATFSADDPLKIATKAPSGIVLCEAGQHDFATFLRAFARTAEGRVRGDGWLLLAGTFEKSRRWYQELYRKGQGANEYELRSHSLPSWSNLALYPEGRESPAIKSMAAGLSPEMFRERFGGEPVAHEDQVFRGESIERCIGPLGQPDGWVTIGCDLGRLMDFTVLVALNSRKQVVAIERWRKVSWVTQVQRITEMYKQLRAKQIAVDSTGLGDPICELLYRSNLSVNPVTITAQSKSEMIDRLSLTLDRGELTIPRDETLIGELWDFQATERASGVDRLEAPEGKHDDMVIALALAVHGARSVPVGVAPELPPLNETEDQRWIREHVEFEGMTDRERWGHGGKGEWD